MTDAPQRSDDAPTAASKSSDAASAQASQLEEARGDAITGRAVTINRPVDEVFGYFRQFSNLPTFMENVEAITVLDDKRSHWVVKAPGGRTV